MAPPDDRTVADYLQKVVEQTSFETVFALLIAVIKEAPEDERKTSLEAMYRWANGASTAYLQQTGNRVDSGIVIKGSHRMSKQRREALKGSKEYAQNLNLKVFPPADQDNHENVPDDQAAPQDAGQAAVHGDEQAAAQDDGQAAAQDDGQAAAQDDEQAAAQNDEDEDGFVVQDDSADETDGESGNESEGGSESDYDDVAERDHKHARRSQRLAERQDQPASRAVVHSGVEAKNPKGDAAQSSNLPDGHEGQGAEPSNLAVASGATIPMKKAARPKPTLALSEDMSYDEVRATVQQHLQQESVTDAQIVEAKKLLDRLLLSTSIDQTVESVAVYHYGKSTRGIIDPVSLLQPGMSWTPLHEAKVAVTVAFKKNAEQGKLALLGTLGNMARTLDKLGVEITKGWKPPARDLAAGLQLLEYHPNATDPTIQAHALVARQIWASDSSLFMSGPTFRRVLRKKHRQGHNVAVIGQYLSSAGLLFFMDDCQGLLERIQPRTVELVLSQVIKIIGFSSCAQMFNDLDEHIAKPMLHGRPLSNDGGILHRLFAGLGDKTKLSLQALLSTASMAAPRTLREGGQSGAEAMQIDHSAGPAGRVGDGMAEVVGRADSEGIDAGGADRHAGEDTPGSHGDEQQDVAMADSA